MTAPTSTGAALLRAVCECPADDAPRLIYADWLEENGGGERAEFVRVQCELARIPWVTDSNPRLLALRARERELWNAQTPAGDWLVLPGRPFGEAHYCLPTDHMASANPREGGLPVFVVRRGFVDEVRCTLASFIGAPCDTCRGSGTVPSGLSAGQYAEETCPVCEGERNTPGLAAALAAPLTAVVLDREPTRYSVTGTRGPAEFSSSETHFWITSVDWQADGRQNWLPAEFRPFLGGYVRDCGPAPRHDAIGHYFADAAAAKVALGLAAVAFARSLVGLPPLPVRGVTT